jgi:5-methylcytosine-specific restriction enzyme A
MSKPWRLCNHPGCRKLTKETYCQDHHYVPPPRKRDKFLDSQAWRDLRDAFVAANPYCESCYPQHLVAAEDVDHILPRRTHPEMALDWNNLQSLCKTCHLEKTRRGL